MKLNLVLIALFVGSLLSPSSRALAALTSSGCKKCNPEPKRGELISQEALDYYGYDREYEEGDIVYTYTRLYSDWWSHTIDVFMLPSISIIKSKEATSEQDVWGNVIYYYTYDKYVYDAPQEAWDYMSEMLFLYTYDTAVKWEDIACGVSSSGVSNANDKDLAPGKTDVSSPAMSNDQGAGGQNAPCSTCSQQPSPTKPGATVIDISLGNDAVGAVKLSYSTSLGMADMLSLASLKLDTPSGSVTGSVASGTVTVINMQTLATVSTATITPSYSGSTLNSLTITVTPSGAGATTSVHTLTRVTDGAFTGIRYTRTEGGTSESVDYYNMGSATVAAADGSIYGVFKTVDEHGNQQIWTAAPEVTTPGPTATFQWVANATELANGGHYTGVLTEERQFIPADASQPQVTYTRTFRKIGSQTHSLKVLVSEETSSTLGSSVKTESTLFGYDEKSSRVNSSDSTLYNNFQFGNRLWTARSDGSWSLNFLEETPHPSITGQTVYGDTLAYAPWQNGPTLPSGFADASSPAATQSFFSGLISSAFTNAGNIAGCKLVRTTTVGISNGAQKLSITSVCTSGGQAITLGGDYDFGSGSSDYGYVWSYGSMLQFPRVSGAERWNAIGLNDAYASGAASQWSAVYDDTETKRAGGSRGSIRVDQSGVGTVIDRQYETDGTYSEAHKQMQMDGLYPGYYGVTGHPLWTRTTFDSDGRVMTEEKLLGAEDAETWEFSSTSIQTVTTTYTGETGSTRSAGGVTLSSQGDDVVAGGQRTSTRTDILGITTTTVTDDATGEMISETRLGLTTNYAKTTGTDGSTTRTVTQTAGGTTRTVSVTVTDAQGRTVSSTDSNGGVTSYSYANNGRTVTTTLPGGGTQITENYLDGQIKSITGTAVTPEYHHFTVNDGSVGAYEAGSITETVYYGTDSGAAWRKTTTNYLGQVLREESPSPSGSGVCATVHSYNAKGQRVKTSRPGMADLIIAYDGWGRVSQQGYDMDADGELTVNSTDVLSTSSTDYVTGEGTVLERVVRQQYTQDGADTDLQTKTERKLLEGSSWQRSTQADGGVFTQFDVISGSTRTVHGQQSVTGTQSQTQIYQNDLLMSETPPGMTSAVTYTYDGFGQVLTVVHPLNGTTTRTYDTAGRVLTQGQTGGDTVTYAYNSQGQVTSETHSDSSTTTYTYDAQGRVLTQGGTAGYPLGYEYDAMGRLWKLHTYRGGGADDITTWTYAAASGVLLSKTDAATTPQSMSYTYDAAGRVLTRTWARGVTTTYSYDGIGRQTGIDYSDATPDVSITYDRAGRRTGTTDAAGTHAYVYDDATSGGQVSGWSVSGTGAWTGLSVGYGNTAGQRSSRTTSLGSITLPTVNYTYDAASGRMSGVSASDFAASYRYDAATGWNSGVTYTSGLSSTRTADALGRLDAITWSVGGATVSGHDYTLNALNRRTAAQRQDGSSWSYGYNARGEVTSAAKGTEPGKQFAFAYDGIGNRTSSSVSSIASTTTLRTTSYSANALNQYDSITHPQPGWLMLRGSANTAAGATVTIDGNVPTLTTGTLWFYEQSVDNTEGPVRREVEITATRPDGGVNNGPVTTQQQGALFIPPPTEVPTYDLDGNLTSDARWNYVWNGENRLVAQEEKTGFIVQPTSSTPVKRIRLEFVYDAQGRRIGKQTFIATGSGGFVLRQSLVHLYDGWNMIAEVDTTSSAQLLRSYEWGTDISGTLAGAGGVGGLLIERFDTTPTLGTHAPCYDGNGNITELVNLTNGNISAHYEYGAFGETISVDGGAPAEANPFRFSTKYLDGETGLYNYGYRYYDAVNGRWLFRDPIGEQGGVNLYGMIGNDSVNKWDYLGLFFTEDSRDRRIREKLDEWHKKLDKSVAELELKLIALCPNEKSPNRIAFGRDQCCTKDSCHIQAKEIAQAFNIAARKVADSRADKGIGNIPNPGGLEGNKIAHGALTNGLNAADADEGFGLKCYGWQALMIQSFETALGKYAMKGKLCFGCAGVEKFSYSLLKLDAHAWVVLYGPKIEARSLSNYDIVIDPWPSGGTDLIPITPYTPRRITTISFELNP